MKKDRHVLETLGKTRIVVENGKVIEVGKPLLRYCPFWGKMNAMKGLNEQVVKENVEFKIEKFGMCTINRKLESKHFVAFGASETFMSALRCGLLDATVTICEGAGTVITANPELEQGIGAQLTGVVETTPLTEIIENIKAKGGVILNPPAIDQARGLQMAFQLGYETVGVTVSQLKDAIQCRAISKQAALFGVHLTGIARKEAEELCKLADLVTACASQHIRAFARKKAILQAGTAIPVFALTTMGKELLLERAKEVNGEYNKNEVLNYVKR